MDQNIYIFTQRLKRTQTSAKLRVRKNSSYILSLQTASIYIIFTFSVKELVRLKSQKVSL